MPPTAAADMEAIVANMTLVDWLDDLTVRFLLNLPAAELSSIPRLCFQVEEAQWFYEDFIRPANPTLPSLNLRSFCLTLFQHCPLLSGFNDDQHLAAYEEFLAYKVRVPVRGAILMDDSMEKVLLVRGWKKGASWSFPRGKINKDEPDLDCAIREVYEETGYDVSAANLVDVNRQQDGQVKAIDVTMREQHMKLFVFRGVPLDTYFEPRTRKEISKIQWYNIKDLPGFKKQKGLAGQGSGEAQTTKFYMVAPFLGHLKKFINQQKRNTATNGQAHVQHRRNLSGVHDGYQTGVTDTEDGEAAPELDRANMYETNDRTADELKRLLSIGQAPTHTPQQAEPGFGAPRNDLLAMLRGGPTTNPVSMDFDPRTPFEQIDSPFPSQTPQTPQAQHPHHSQDRAAGMGQHPQLGYSPQRMQQLQQSQRNSSLPMQGVFAGYNNGQPAQQHQNNVPPHMQQHIFHQEQQRQHSLPNFQHAPPQHQPQYQQQQNLGPRPNSQQQMSLLQAFHSPGRSQPPMTSNRPVSQGFPPIGSGPAVPEASKLPPPRLNAHSMSLLDAFKGTNGSNQSSEIQQKSFSGPLDSASGPRYQRVGSQQQASLLDLFRKPSSGQPSPQPPQQAQPMETAPIPAVSSPALSDATITGRKSTTNEITRTLPAKVKAKAPPPKSTQQSNEPPREEVPERRATNGRTHAHTNIRNQRASPKAPRRPEQQMPQFSILQRPGSSGGKASPAPLSPLRFESSNSSQTAFHPQVLKRPTSAEGSGNEKVAGNATEVQAQAPSQRNDTLLDLLNGRSTTPVALKTPEPPQAPAIPAQAPAASQRNNSLLDLLNGRSTPPVVKTPEPPPAPQLLPERKASHQHSALPTASQQKNQHLLNLFTNPGSFQKTGGSPGTPISPFTLGTPAAASKHREPSFSEDVSARSRLGSMASVRSGMSSGQQTPTEAKDFMLGYLNGVVQKEGYRGAKKP